MENNIGKRIKELADVKGVTIIDVERAVGLSNGQLAKWKSRAPRIDKANEVANYFSVSLDYLYGREEKEILIKQEGNESENVSDDMVEVMEKMQGMTKEERRKVRDIVNVLDKK